MLIFPYTEVMFLQRIMCVYREVQSAQELELCYLWVGFFVNFVFIVVSLFSFFTVLRLCFIVLSSFGSRMSSYTVSKRGDRFA